MTGTHYCGNDSYELSTRYDADAQCDISTEPCPECNRQFIMFVEGAEI